MQNHNTALHLRRHKTPGPASTETPVGDIGDATVTKTQGSNPAGNNAHARRLLNAIRNDARAMEILNSPKFIRLPAPGGRDPLTGLSRGTLNELILSCPANGCNPPVRSVLIRKKGATRGVRLVDVFSLLSHLDTLANGGGDSSGSVEIQEEGGQHE